MQPDAQGASVHAIVERHRAQPLAVASVRDFRLDAGEHVDPAEALSDPCWSPYCLDPETASVWLVALPSTEDAGAAPFLYAAQHRLAQRVLRVPFDAFLRVCHTLPDPARLLLIHTTGRSGSTLLTLSLGELEGVRTLSEPDVFTQGAMAGPAEGPQLRALLAAVYRGCLRLLCREPARLHVIKLRSIVVEHADLVGAGMPGVRRVFLYRDPVAVSRSTARILGRDPDHWRLDAAEVRGWRALAPLLPSSGLPVDAYTLYAALWAGPVAAYLRLQRPDAGWIGSLRYEALCADPVGTLRALLTACDCDVPLPGRPPEVFQRDAQQGSALEREHLHATRPDALRERVSSPGFADRVRAALRQLAPALPLDTDLPAGISPDA